MQITKISFQLHIKIWDSVYRFLLMVMALGPNAMNFCETNLTNLVVPFQNKDPFSFNKVHCFSSLRDKSCQSIEHISLLDVQHWFCKNNCTLIYKLFSTLFSNLGPTLTNIGIQIYKTRIECFCLAHCSYVALGSQLGIHNIALSKTNRM